MNMMKRLVSIGLVSLFFFGCAPKAVVRLLRPGELNLRDVSKIVILDFNTIQMGSKTRLPVGKDILELAKKSFVDCFYSAPFYTLVDLNMERCVTGKQCNIQKKYRADALLYGTVWWEITDEFDNFKPDSMRLSQWRMKSYPCGKDKKGNTKYCSKPLTTETHDEFYRRNYRAVAASLVISLYVYKFHPDGRIEKITQVMELVREKAKIENGEFKLESPRIIGAEAQTDKMATLKGKAGQAAGAGQASSGLSDVFGGINRWMSSSGSSDRTGQPKVIRVERKVDTIPTDLEFKIRLTDTVNRELQRRIAPHFDTFEIPIPLQTDTKINTLVQAQAYSALGKYLIEEKLAQRDPDAADMLYNVDLDGAGKRVVEKMHRQELAKEGKPDAPLPPEELKRQTDKYLSDHVWDLYMAALSFEATGDFGRALEMYLQVFKKYKNEDQRFADGIGRCLMATGMAYRVDWQHKSRREAGNANKL
jgi:hypothetical protein